MFNYKNLDELNHKATIKLKIYQKGNVSKIKKALKI
jgi:hypothetical protein